MAPPVFIEKPKAEKVAVVGSGPAGLSAAYQLGRRGYKVTDLRGASGRRRHARPSASPTSGCRGTCSTRHRLHPPAQRRDRNGQGPGQGFRRQRPLRAGIQGGLPRDGREPRPEAGHTGRGRGRRAAGRRVPAAGEPRREGKSGQKGGGHRRRERGDRRSAGRRPQRRKERNHHLPQDAGRDACQRRGDRRGRRRKDRDRIPPCAA